MDKPIDYIALSIPIFFLLIGLELLIDRLKNTQLYRFNDAVTNISCGIGQQVIGVFLKTLTVLLYVYVYENYRLIAHLPSSLLTCLALFVGVDFCYYWFHRATHHINVLWGSHVVHHQSEEYNLTVALRQSWIQSVFSNLFYLPLAYIGFDPALFVTLVSFQTLYQFWIHTRTINKMPAWFEYVFNTPSHHRVHHGVNPIYIDRNHGGTLILFDRWFGTFQAEQEEVVYGVTVQPNSWNPLWLNLESWVALWHNLRRVPNWGDRWQMLWRSPGWVPPSANQPAALPFNPQRYHKYDTEVSLSLNYYVLLHYVVTLSAATVFLFSADAYALPFRLLAAALVIWAIMGCGAVLEQRRYALYTEPARLLATAALGIALANNYWIAAWLLFSLVSAIWLRSAYR